jgi:D-psicose/D-tagatose/L-ribulose 3-epimerase
MSNPVGIISMQFVRPLSMANLKLFEVIRKLGFDFVELLMPEPEDGLDLKEVRRALEDCALDIVLAARLNAARSIADADDGAGRGGLDYLTTCIDAAAELGAKIVGGPLYGGPLVFAGRAPSPISDDQMRRTFDRCVERLAIAADAAEKADLRLALEPLNRFETDVVSTTSQAIELVDAVGSPALGLLLDSFHMNIEEPSIPDAIRQAGARIVHFQANENHRGFPGTGHLPWADIGRALHDVGYAGPVSLEPFRRDDDRFALPIAQWRAPHDDESERLRESLAFIRSTLRMAADRR